MEPPRGPIWTSISILRYELDAASNKHSKTHIRVEVGFRKKNTAGSIFILLHNIDVA